MRQEWVSWDPFRMLRLYTIVELYVLSIWSVLNGAHQLDLIVKKVFNDLMNETFLKTLTGVTGNLWHQQNLSQEMNSACPAYVTTHWISMGKVLKWLKANRVKLLLNFYTKKPACTPLTEWWLVVIINQALVECIVKTFKAMQGMKTLVSETVIDGAWTWH